MEISLALGGGGIKGIAHIGVLQCLEDAGLKIGAIAGTSAGGLVGSMYAAGYSPSEIQAITESLDSERLYKRRPDDRPSLLGLTGLVEAMGEVIGDTLFSELKIPFACTAVDIRTAQEIYLGEGRVLDAVLATVAAPGIFPPRLVGETELIDGGVLDPVPVNLARCLAPALPVVAIVLNPKQADFHLIPMFSLSPMVPIPSPLMDGISKMRVAQALKIFVQSMDITGRMLTEFRLKVDKPEVIVRPDVHEYGMLDEVVPSMLIQAGYRATEEALADISRTLSWGNTIMRILRQPIRRRQAASKQAETRPARPSVPAPVASLLPAESENGASAAESAVIPESAGSDPAGSDPAGTNPASTDRSGTDSSAEASRVPADNQSDMPLCQPDEDMSTDEVRKGAPGASNGGKAGERK